VRNFVVFILLTKLCKAIKWIMGLMGHLARSSGVYREENVYESNV